MRAYREFNEAAPFTQFDDIIGLIDIVAVEECERFLSEMKDIHEQQCDLMLKELKDYEYRSLNK
jgi:cyclopropane fatty-acyl-phospholipid synthase-like methyltransferase